MANVSGTLTTNSLRRKPPLHERGIQKLFVLYEPFEEMEFVRVSLGVFQQSHDSVSAEPFIPSSFVSNLFLKEINNGGFIEAESSPELGSEILDNLGWSPWGGWNGGYYFKDSGKAVQERLIEEGFDAVLFIKEDRLPDFFRQTRLRIGAKGLVMSQVVNAYAGFRVSLIEMEKGKEIWDRSYVQASAVELAGLQWKPKFEAYTEAEKGRIIDAVRERIVHNVSHSLRMLKVVPIDGGDFLSKLGPMVDIYAGLQTTAGRGAPDGAIPSQTAKSPNRTVTQVSASAGVSGAPSAVEPNSG